MGEGLLYTEDYSTHYTNRTLVDLVYPHPILTDEEKEKLTIERRSAADFELYNSELMGYLN